MSLRCDALLPIFGQYGEIVEVDGCVADHVGFWIPICRGWDCQPGLGEGIQVQKVNCAVTTEGCNVGGDMIWYLLELDVRRCVKVESHAIENEVVLGEKIHADYAVQKISFRRGNIENDNRYVGKA